MRAEEEDGGLAGRWARVMQEAQYTQFIHLSLPQDKVFA